MDNKQPDGRQEEWGQAREEAVLRGGADQAHAPHDVLVGHGEVILQVGGEELYLFERPRKPCTFFTLQYGRR